MIVVFEKEESTINITNTINVLVNNNYIPIINENDSVVVDELVVGDNDNLAAQVAEMCNADLLIICSDVDGLFDLDLFDQDDRIIDDDSG